MRRLLFGVMAAVLVGCSSPAAGQDVKRGTVLGVYELELDGCVQRGQEAHNIAVYRTCADAVDARFGVQRDAGMRDQ